MKYTKKYFRKSKVKKKFISYKRKTKLSDKRKKRKTKLIKKYKKIKVKKSKKYKGGGNFVFPINGITNSMRNVKYEGEKFFNNWRGIPTRDSPNPTHQPELLKSSHPIKWAIPNLKSFEFRSDDHIHSKMPQLD